MSRSVKQKPRAYGCRIRWGTDPEAQAKPCSYSFATKAELEAFLLGVDESSGWLEYEVVEDGVEGTEEA